MDTTPPPLPTNPTDDKIWIILCHLSLILGIGFILPLIVYFVKKTDAPLTAAHAKEAFNFHLSIYIYMFISILLCTIFIGIPLVVIIPIFAIVCAIIACVKASEGAFYHYPLTIRIL